MENTPQSVSGKASKQATKKKTNKKLKKTPIPLKEKKEVSRTSKPLK